MKIHRFSERITKLKYLFLELLCLLSLGLDQSPLKSVQAISDILATSDSVQKNETFHALLPTSTLGNNIVTNGNFETPDVTVSTFRTYFPNQSIGGWIVEGHSVDHISERYWQAADGRQSIDLSGNSNGAVSQTLTTNPSQQYLLQFAFTGNPERSPCPNPPAIKQMEVWWDTTLVATLSVNTTGRSNWNMGWAHYQDILIATDATTELRFKSLTPGCYGPLLDMVSVQSYAGEDIPLLDLPLDYTDKKFADVALGNLPDDSNGLVNSWFDHDTPDYQENSHVQVWTGQNHTDTDIENLDSRNCKTGINCYNGHNGIDFQRHKHIVNGFPTYNDTIYAAAPGIVVDLCINFPCYYPGTQVKIRDDSYGRWLLIQHGGIHGKYATFYAHLASINVTKGQEIPIDTKSVPIGTMGGSGGFPIHLHFGVYYDDDGDGKWEDKYQGYTEAVDPYGWFGELSDPWWNQSAYLWKYPLHDSKVATQEGAIITSPSGKGKLTIAAGVFSDPTALELWDLPTPQIPPGNLKEVGHSVRIRAGESSSRTVNSLSPGFPNAADNITIGAFPHPVSINIRYGIENTKHINTNQMSIYWLNDATGAWSGLPTTINESLKEATAQTESLGYFSLQAPLLCPTDTQEPNDSYDNSSSVEEHRASVNNLFDIAQDEDWFQFNASAGRTYQFATTNLSSGVNPILEVYNVDGTTLLTSDDNSGGGNAASLIWRAPTNGAYFVRVSRAASGTFGCSSSYTFNIIPISFKTSIYVGGMEQASYYVLMQGSMRQSLRNLNSGPVNIANTDQVSIIAAERVIYKVNGVNTSFSEMMGLPASQLDTTYWLPWYNNVDLDTQLRIANVSGSQASITVTIGGVPRPSFNLAPGASTRLSYPGVNNGPVKIASTQNIVAAERVIYKVHNTNTSFTEMMALPQRQLDTVYYLPWYNNVDLDTQLRIANVSGSQATVTVTIGGIPRPSFNLAPGASTRLSYPGVNSGPVKIASTQNIVAAERVIYKVHNTNTSFTEMMALPASQVSSMYWLPWYNNVDLDTQLRIANVSGSQATVTVTIGGIAQPSFNLAAGGSIRISYAANNGPVKIVSTQNIVAAERVIYRVNTINTSFSEMMGLPNGHLDTTYWLPWYNNVDLDTQLRFGVP